MKDHFTSHRSYLTAIPRKTLPVPTRWLIHQGLIRLPVLDYGCGKCYKVNPWQWINYDPYHYKIDIDCFRGSFMTVVCNYVLCTLPPSKRVDVLRDIQSLLMHQSDSAAYIAVRADRPRSGWGISSHGTYQGQVRKLPGKLIHTCNQYRIFRLTRADKLV